MTLRRKRFKKL